jgi:hypothetical protein
MATERQRQTARRNIKRAQAARSGSRRRRSTKRAVRDAPPQQRSVIAREINPPPARELSMEED